MRPQAFLFDMDGLLVDSEPVWHRAELAVVARWGGAWTAEDQAYCTGRGIPETARRMAERAGRVFDAARDPAILVDAFLELRDSVALTRGALEAIAFAERVGKLAVASSSPRRVVEAVLAAHDLLHRFHAVITGDDVARVKPEPDIFLLAAERVAADPAACVVLEDSPAGVLAGKRAGMRVVAVPTPEMRARISGADHVVGDLHEAVALFEV
ncbi:MAG: HAD family phosphatase [Polyangiaceae bacterium]